MNKVSKKRVWARTTENYLPFWEENATPDKTKLATYHFGTLSSTTTIDLFAAPGDIEILEAYILVNTTIAADGSNYWDIVLYNSTQVPAKSIATGGGASVAISTGDSDTPAVKNSLTLETGDDRLVAADEILQVVFTKNASASNLVGCVLVVEYKQTSLTTSTSSTSTTTSTTTTTTTTTSTTTSTTTTTTTSTSTSTTTTTTTTTSTSSSTTTTTTTSTSTSTSTSTTVT